MLPEGELMYPLRLYRDGAGINHKAGFSILQNYGAWKGQCRMAPIETVNGRQQHWDLIEKCDGIRQCARTTVDSNANVPAATYTSLLCSTQVDGLHISI